MNRLKLYNTAKFCLEMDLVQDATATNDVQCAAQVNAIYYRAFSEHIGGGASTQLLYETLKKDARFEMVSDPLPGDIIISPTGYSTKGAPHGHVGIVGYHGVMSNNSLNGLWQEVYSLESWNTYFHDKLGFPVEYFRVL